MQLMRTTVFRIVLHRFDLPIGEAQRPMPRERGFYHNGPATSTTYAAWATRGARHCRYTVFTIDHDPPMTASTKSSTLRAHSCHMVPAAAKEESSPDSVFAVSQDVQRDSSGLTFKTGRRVLSGRHVHQLWPALAIIAVIAGIVVYHGWVD